MIRFVCALLTSLQEFTEDRAQFLPPWVLYFSGCEERDRLLAELDRSWTDVFQVSETSVSLIYAINLMNLKLLIYMSIALGESGS